MRQSRLRHLSLAIVGCFTLCLVATLTLATAFHHTDARAASAIPAMRLVRANSPQRSSQASPASRTLAADRYERLPLAFEQAGAESASGAKFLARGDGYALFLTPSETVLALGKHHDRSAVLRLSMAGANASPSFAALDELPGKTNYFLGNSPATWRTNVPNYRKVAERGIYKGIDVIYYGNQHQLEYDFVVAPGSDPGAIQIAFQGAKSLRIDSDGDLLVNVGAAGPDVRMRKPIAYQGSGDTKREVAASYTLKGAHSVSFELGRYDSGQQLVIDPVLSYSTYLGGTNIDGGNAIAVAPDNTAFIAGGTFSTDFPIAHPLQANHGGPDDFYRDAFVAKISADGSTLLYSTYLGGKLEDVANGIAVDSAGDAYVAGTTDSLDFPVTFGSFNPECGGDAQCGASFNPGKLIVSNCFVTKLNQAGSAIIYSGFLGEYENVGCQAIAVDQNEYAYVTGQTGPNGVPTVPIVPPATPPPPFPIVGGAFPNFGGGPTDAFVAKISATGTTIEYSSYLGGSNEDIGYGIAVDNAGDAFVAGLTYSGDFPVTASAAQLTYGGAGDAFASEVSTTASGPASLLYSTYLGGSGLDQANSVANLNGNVYVAGGTNSNSLLFPSAPGYPNPKKYGGEGDAFAAELNPAMPGAAGILYFTYLGGSNADSASGIAVDTNIHDQYYGNAFVTGSTVSADFITSAPPAILSGAFQPTYGGGNADSFVTELNSTGTALVYSSYLGGTNTEIPGGIAVDSTGSAYVTGQTCSQDFPVSNPLQAAPGGNCDAYISKVSIQHGIAVNPAGLVFSAQSLGTTSAPQTLTITNGDSPVMIIANLSGPQSGDFIVASPTTPLPSGSQCPTSGTFSMPLGIQCTISVAFRPSAPGIRKAVITISGKDANNIPIPSLVINLTGNTSTVTLSSSSLSFTSQAVGTSASQQVTVTNTGSVALTFSSITASGGFSQTNNCSVSLQPTTNCTIGVTYSPTSAGSSIGALTLTDNGTGSPQVVLLTGIGFQQNPDFSLSTSQPSATISAGQSAMYALTISPIGGFSQPVTLTCSGLPRGAACFVSSNPVAVNGATSITVTVTTAVRTFVPAALRKFEFPGSTHGLGGVLSASFLVFLSAMILAKLRWRPARAVFGLVVVLLLLAAACGGNLAGVPAGTPAGTSQITVTGTSGSLAHPVTLTLNVN